MNNYRIGFTFSFQGGPVKTNFRNVKADDPDTAVYLLLKYTPSAINAWVVEEAN
tara:strand:+ start:380 stop:541 length:162 start_codon:yes stop_codon:yes gene_type:complete